LLQWFDELYWTPISDLVNYVETENNLENFTKGEFYAYAEKQGDSVIVYLYNPDNDKVFQNNKPIDFDEVEFNFYKTTKLKGKTDDEGNETVSFRIKEEDVTISVFNAFGFEELLKTNGESLFSKFIGEYTTKFNELEDILKKKSIKVSNDNSKFKITEPPLLEDYFYRIQLLCKSIQNRKIYTDYSSELNKELDSNDSPTLYKALLLSKIFNETDMTGILKTVCEERINNLIEILDLDTRRFQSLKKQWH